MPVSRQNNPGTAPGALARELDAPFAVTADRTTQYAQDGYVKLPGVLSGPLLRHYGEEITRKVLELNPHTAPIAERSTYHRAFIQVTNLWEQSGLVREFVFGERLARIAAELLQVRGVRLYHDQALYKEPGGGFTPWHADQQYWPLASDKCITAWIPLQATPMQMGPLAFAAHSQHFEGGRSLAISDESETQLQEMLTAQGFQYVQEPFAEGEVSFHSGWTYHRAGPNTTQMPRAVMTIIYMDVDMRLARPANPNQEKDSEVFCPGIGVGEVIASARNPVLFTRGA